MLRLLCGGFLIAHGLIHVAIWLPQAFGVRAAAQPTAPFDPGHSWMLSALSDNGARWLSVALAIAAALGYIAAGSGLFANQEWWRGVTVGASIASLALVLIYFTPWLSAALLIDSALVLTLMWAHWPSVEQIGV